jgi:hypothetical protein
MIVIEDKLNTSITNVGFFSYFYNIVDTKIRMCRNKFNYVHLGLIMVNILCYWKEVQSSTHGIRT